MLDPLQHFGEGSEAVPEKREGGLAMPEEDQNLISNLVDANKENLSEEKSLLIKKVLVDVISGCVLEQRNVDEVRQKIKNEFELVVLLIKDILEKHKFFNGEAMKHAELIAKILREDFDLIDDIDAAEAEEHELAKPPHHKDDSRFDALNRMKRKHKRLNELLENMLTDDEGLGSLVPENERAEYLDRFAILCIEMLKAPQTVEEWRASRVRKELLAKYIIPYANKYPNFSLKDK